MDAFFEQLAPQRYRALPASAGPWDPRHQHGGPPSALLARAVEVDTPPRSDLRIARIAVDILRPVPVAEVTTTARVVRSGRRSDLVEAELSAGGEPFVRLTARRIADTADSVPATKAGPPPVLPSSGVVLPWARDAHTDGYLSAVEFRFAVGSPEDPGPAFAWGRCDLDLVTGSRPSALEHALLLTDSASGISAELDFARWLFANTDLTVVLHRPPPTRWLGIEAETLLGDDGVGCTKAVLWSESGPVGHSLQTLAVAPRQR